MSDMNNSRGRNLFDFDFGTADEPRNQEEQPQEDSGRGLFEFRTGFSENGTEGKGVELARRQELAPRNAEEEENYKAYTAYRDCVVKANRQTVDAKQAAYNTERKSLDWQQQQTNQARAAYEKAVNDKKGLGAAPAAEQKAFAIKVDGKDIVAPIKNAYMRGWMTPAQTQYMKSSAGDVLIKLGFTERGQLESYESNPKNVEWLRKFLNPPLTTDIFKKYVVRKCYIPALIGYIFCLLSFFQGSFFTWFCNISMFFLGMGQMQIFLAIIRFFTVRKGARPETSSIGAILQFVIAVAMGSIVSTVYRSAALESFAPAAIAAFLLCLCSVFFMANMIAAIPFFANLITKRDSSLQQSLYAPLFQDAERVNGASNLFFCLLHHNEMAAMLDCGSYAANMKNAERRIAWTKMDLDKAEAALSKRKDAVEKAKEELDQAQKDFDSSMKPIAEWTKSPSARDMIDYYTEVCKENNGSDPFFPDMVWFEKYDQNGVLYDVLPLVHNGEPIRIALSRERDHKNFVADTAHDVCRIIQCIRKLYPKNMARISVLEPMAESLWTPFNNENINLKSWEKHSEKGLEKGEVYWVTDGNLFGKLESEIAAKRSNTRDFLEQSREDMSGKEYGGTNIAKANQWVFEKNTRPLCYDFLLIYVPTENAGYSFNIYENIDKLLGIDSKEFGILPIYFTVKGRRVDEKWNELLDRCKNTVEF